MTDDDAARAFRESYRKKNPDLLSDDDPNALGVGHDHADVGEPGDNTSVGDTHDNGRAIRVKCVKCGARNRVLPPEGFRFVEDDDPDDDGLDGRALKFRCHCAARNLVKRLPHHRLVGSATEAADVFAREYAARTSTPEWGNEDDEPSRFFRESYAQTEDDDLWRRCRTQDPRG
jgi:hypothetical protein